MWFVCHTLGTNQTGPFFGFTETFEGLAVIVNTNRNLLATKRPGEPTGRHRDVAIVANNGTRSFYDLVANMEGCNANVRFDEGRDDFNVMQVRFWFIFWCGGQGRAKLSTVYRTQTVVQRGGEYWRTKCVGEDERRELQGLGRTDLFSPSG